MTHVERINGHGHANGHHGEILQGIFQGKNGETQRGLVTMPCPMAASRAVYEAVLGEGLSIHPYGCRKALAAAKCVLERLNRQDWGGCITIETNIPEGLGLGSSSADLNATMRAVLNAFKAELPPADLAALAVQAETASDPVTVHDAVLFAQRDGEIIETFGPQLPPMLVIGVNTAPGQTVDTLSHPPAEYGPAMLAEFERLRERLWTAIKDGDVDAVGHVATRSARINQDFLPKARFDDLLALAPEIGASGVQVAHSGTVAGLIFDVMSKAATDPSLIVTRLEADGFARSVTFTTGGF